MTTRKVGLLRILFIIDPLKKLDKRWDNSLHLLNEMNGRGHENWAADACDLRPGKSGGTALCHQITAKLNPRKRTLSFHTRPSRRFRLEQFDLILIRKEPPVDAAYFEMLLTLERLAGEVPMVNHPAGIRVTNEKLSILDFQKWIPKTMVSSSPSALAAFQKRLKKAVVVKPLDQKGGKGVFLLRFQDAQQASRLNRATERGTRQVMAQEFIRSRKAGEKRIVILNGKVLGAYRKKAKSGEFRANLGLGASFHATTLTSRELKLIAALRPYLLKRGLYLAGIDVLEEKLIEINVTSPAGITEIKFLHPQQRPVEAWADFLERFAAGARGRSLPHSAGRNL